MDRDVKSSSAQRGHFETGGRLAHLLYVIITLLPQMTAWIGSTSYVIRAMFVYRTKTGTEYIWHDTVNLRSHFFCWQTQFHNAACGVYMYSRSVNKSDLFSFNFNFQSEEFGVENYWPGRVSCTPGSCVPGHEWQQGSHSGPSGPAFPVSASCSSPFDQSRGKRRVDATRLVPASIVQTVGIRESRETPDKPSSAQTKYVSYLG